MWLPAGLCYFILCNYQVYLIFVRFLNKSDQLTENLIQTRGVPLGSFIFHSYPDKLDRTTTDNSWSNTWEIMKYGLVANPIIYHIDEN